MTYDKVLVWLIAVLSADTALTTLIGGAKNVGRYEDDMPSTTGVYVRIPEQSRDERFAQTVDVMVNVYSSVSEADCATILDRVATLLAQEPGEPKTWTPTPASKGLFLYWLRTSSVTTPERDGEPEDGHSATLKLVARCAAA